MLTDDHTPEGSAAVAPSTPAEATAPLPQAAVLAAATTALAACGDGTISNVFSAAPSVATPAIPAMTKTEAARFLLQASLSATPGAITEVVSEGCAAWLDRQMRLQNDENSQQYLARIGFDQVDANKRYDDTGAPENMIWSQLMTGGNPVRKRIALALSEYFVVSSNALDQRWRGHMAGAYWDLLNRHAFGNFRELLEAISLNAAMGVFLDTRGNQRANPATFREPDENYAREVMQLFTIGLFKLNLDGTEELAGGAPIETYTNADVTGLARVFTGYNFDYTGVTYTPEVGGTTQIQSWHFHYKPMTSDSTKWSSPRTDNLHSREEKRFLGLTIPANTNAPDSLRLALDHLFAHPNVGPFFSKQMIQRLVTSNPTPAYVARVASVFNNNGRGVRGDLAAVFKAILLDDEARASRNVANPGFGKLREPILRFVQFARTFAMTSVSGTWELPNTSDAATRLNQSPLRAPSVFNFFRPTYFPPNTNVSANGMVAPEFQLVHETTVAAYVNFLVNAVDSGTNSNFVDVDSDYTREVAIAADSNALIDHLDLLLTAGQLGPQTRAQVKSAVDAIPGTAEADRLRRVKTAILLIMVSTDYLIQK